MVGHFFKLCYKEIEKYPETRRQIKRYEQRSKNKREKVRRTGDNNKQAGAKKGKEGRNQKARTEKTHPRY
jgi:hypothetical protein